MVRPWTHASRPPPSAGATRGRTTRGTTTRALRETGFFSINGSWNSEYGQFFLKWYSDRLLGHCDRIMGAASDVLRRRWPQRQARAVAPQLHSFESLQCHIDQLLTAQAAANASRRPQALLQHPSVRRVGAAPELSVACAQGAVGGPGHDPAVCQVGAKLAGVHWWWKTASHASELTAGYYNTWFHDGYVDVMDVLARHHARASFTCVEMRDCEHPPEAKCSPQGVAAPAAPPAGVAACAWLLCQAASQVWRMRVLPGPCAAPARTVPPACCSQGCTPSLKAAVIRRLCAPPAWG